MRKKLCGNCFSVFKGGVCPKCGYTERRTRAEYDALAAGTVLNGQYIVGRVLGRGGFGIIYLSYDEKNDKTVAIKEFYPDDTAVRGQDNITVEPMTTQQSEAYITGLERFMNEAEIIMKFRESSEILGVYDFFRENGTAYYVMEFVKGVSLKQYSEKNGAISAEQAVYIAERLLPALAVLHSADTLHRDVCPDNIMLCADGSVKLIDFGSARVSGNGRQTMSVILKPGFAPLEQYSRKGNQDGRTDIYSLAMSLYFGLTLETPEDPLTRLDTDNIFPNKLKKVPYPLCGIIAKAAAVKPENRYGSAEDMLSEIRSYGIKARKIDTEKINDCKADINEAKPRKKRRRTFYAAAVSAAVVSLFGLTAAGFIKNDEAAMVKIGGEMYSVETTELDLSGRELTNAQIPNLKHLKDLVYLNLNDNYITDLSCLEGLTKLEELYFNNNNVSDISFMGSMSGLKKVSGENSGVSDISVLSDKTELEEVFFGDCYITDITPLKNSRGLRKMGFNEMQIGDLEAIRGMTELEMVCLAGCNLTDISPLSDSKGLKFVYLGRNSLTDLSPLSGCDIAELYIDNNRLSGHGDTFAGITLNGFVCMEGNGFTEDEVARISQTLDGSFEIYWW